MIAHAALALCLADCLFAVASSSAIDASTYTKAAELVAVAPDRRLNLFCSGEGEPTVLLEAGAASSMVVWGFVQPELSKHMRVCSYDRAGMGFSDPADRPSDASNIVEDLHALLVNAHERPPYILAAHSAGALYARLYAARYPSEVVAMVLVDPASEYQSDAYQSVDPRHRSPAMWHKQVEAKEQPALHACVTAAEVGTLIPGRSIWKHCVDDPSPVFSNSVQKAIEAFESRPSYQRAALSEDEQFAESEGELRAAPNRYLDSMPLIVLTQAPAASDTTGFVWLGLNARIAGWSRRGEQDVIPGVGHAIQLERPDLVVAAVERVMAAWKEH